VSLYRGPILLAWDQADNAFDESAIPRIDPAMLPTARLVADKPGDAWLAIEVPTAAKPLRLRDFASAGSRGTRYRSWLRTTVTPRDPGTEGLLIGAGLRGNPGASPGHWTGGTAFTGAGDHVALDGKDQLLTYALPDGWPAEATVSVRLRIREWPAENRLAQVFSAWSGAGDDPLRITVQSGRIFARVEAGSFAGTGGFAVSPGAWHHVAAVKRSGSVTLFVDGEPAGSATLTGDTPSKSRLCALGGNPLYRENSEFLAADFAGFHLYGRALSEAEIAALAAAR
jgi:hypothetical protein